MEQNEVMVKMVLDRWNALNKNFDDTLNALSDADLQREIAPGRNRGIYLLGHMVAVHDDMLRLLDFGNKQYPDLYKPFVESADKAVADLPSAKELRKQWAEINVYLSSKINALTPAQWFEKHTAVNAEDFAKEPHRNKLNIMVTRCTHLAYHHGQIILLEAKKHND
ncbi:MAG: DinB family protein [Bacteroidetes bacterium]|nr:DinB family protein [Bacteroidota bacterium]